MSNNKLNYKQYKHLIDVFTTGDFLTESLDKPVGLITYRKLLTENNILYFTQNTRRTCRIPLGISKRDGTIKYIDLMENTFTYRHEDTKLLINFAKLVICNLMQNYRPDEYVVYHDLNIEELGNFHRITDASNFDDIYTSISVDRHKKYSLSGDITYKQYRKTHKEKLIIFILTKQDNINRIKAISGASMRYGIAILNLEQDDIANSSTLSLVNTIRPNISDAEMREEIEIYKRMLGEFNKMINEINLLTGEIINEGDLHEQLVLKLPLPKELEFLIDTYKENLKLPDLNDEQRLEIENDIQSIIQGHADTRYSLYNMREYGYQFGGLNANGDFGSFYHHLLRYHRELNVDALKYIITASVYTIFGHSSPMLSSALRKQDDIGHKDKELLDAYIDRQVDYYKTNRTPFKLEIYDDMLGKDIVLYETFFCKVELRDKRLFITIGEKEKQLPNGLLYFIDLGTLTMNQNMLELIIRYEMYLVYGIHIPGAVSPITWYTEDVFIEQHKPVSYHTDLEAVRDIMVRLTKIGAFDKTYNTLSYKEYKELISSAYSELEDSEIKTYTNYWLWRKDDLRKILPKDNDTVQNMNLF